MTDESMREALKRMKRVANQNSEMHSMHQAYLTVLKRGIDVASLLIGFGLAIMVFADPGSLGWIGIGAGGQATMLGVLGIVNFVAALMVLYFRPAKAAEAHRRARRHYTQVKGIIAELLKRETIPSNEFKEVSAAYYDDEELPDIPVRFFNHYKARHLKKVELSKILSDCPGLSRRTAGRLLKERLREKGCKS